MLAKPRRPSSSGSLAFEAKIESIIKFIVLIHNVFALKPVIHSSIVKLSRSRRSNVGKAARPSSSGRWKTDNWRILSFRRAKNGLCLVLLGRLGRYSMICQAKNSIFLFSDQFLEGDELREVGSKNRAMSTFLEIFGFLKKFWFFENLNNLLYFGLADFSG